jgi:hypothetical protein
MRKRVNLCGFAGHANPAGRSYRGRIDILEKKFLAGDITKEELREYANLLHGGGSSIPQNEGNHKDPEKHTILVFGKPVEVSEKEYQDKCKEYGF